MMAQTAGKCLDASRPGRGKAMLVQIHNATFRSWVRPDERAEIHASVTSNAPLYATALCHVMVEDKKVASAELMFTFVPESNFSAGFRDQVLEDYLSRTAPSQNRE
jgi:3-hydroxymyristoyl/3-hydroxydecanoyl-(acyl carrier protein) dehydratase